MAALAGVRKDVISPKRLAALAAYIAKYATKGTGATEGADRPIRDVAHVEHLRISEHHRRMITTAWELGGIASYDALNLRRWAHMLGFRGHFLTKSHRYSTTFTALRAVRRSSRLRADLDALNHDTHGANEIAPDLDTVTVINDWWPVHYGHRDDGERELAAAIGERHLDQRHWNRSGHPGDLPPGEGMSISLLRWEFWCAVASKGHASTQTPEGRLTLHLLVGRRRWPP